MNSYGCLMGFIVFVVSLSVVVWFTVYYTGSAYPIWALLIIVLYDCSSVKCLRGGVPTHWITDAETGEYFEYVKVKDLK